MTYLKPIINILCLLNIYNIVGIRVYKANAQFKGGLNSVLVVVYLYFYLYFYFLSWTGLQATSVAYLNIYICVCVYVYV
jgi:hypothetical protein